MPTCKKQQRSQQPEQLKTTLVFTTLDPAVVTELLEQNGHIVSTLEYRRIPNSIINTSTFARLMALRVARYGHPLVLDKNIQGMSILEVVKLIPEDLRSKITALSPDLSHLPIPTVQVPAATPI